MSIVDIYGHNYPPHIQWYSHGVVAETYGVNGHNFISTIPDVLHKPSANLPYTWPVCNYMSICHSSLIHST